jgi:hypothetical protein
VSFRPPNIAPPTPKHTTAREHCPSHASPFHTPPNNMQSFSKLQMPQLMCGSSDAQPPTPQTCCGSKAHCPMHCSHPPQTTPPIAPHGCIPKCNGSIPRQCISPTLWPLSVLSIVPPLSLSPPTTAMLFHLPHPKRHSPQPPQTQQHHPTHRCISSKQRSS